MEKLTLPLQSVTFLNYSCRGFFLCVFRKGYEAAVKGFDTQDLDVSVVGRSFMITGANSGIGRATAMAVAKKGRPRFALC